VVNLNINLELGRLIEKKGISSIKKSLAYANLKINPYVWVGLNINLAILITVVVNFAVYFSTQNPLYVIISLFFVPAMYYLIISTILSVLSDQRARFVEETLPDALLLMSSNLRSGLATDEAIMLSARPEFGFLADKLREAGGRVTTGETFESAFSKLSEGVDSQILEKTVNLIIEGIESGGEMATLLEETATDIRDNDLLQREVRSVILVYALFIFIAAVVTAPILYAISTHLAGALSRLSGAISVAFLTRGAPTLNIVPSEISTDFLLTFSYINLIITAVFGALMVALITRGNERYGIRYIPLFVVISMIIFLVVRYLVSGFFGSIRI
jgi:flagellar protein FlaJ